MSDKLVSFMKDWKGVIAVIIAAAASYGFQMKRIEELEKDIVQMSEIQQSIVLINLKLERIATNQENIKETIKELKTK